MPAVPGRCPKNIPIVSYPLVMARQWLVQILRCTVCASTWCMTGSGRACRAWPACTAWAGVAAVECLCLLSQRNHPQAPAGAGPPPWRVVRPGQWEQAVASAPALSSQPAGQGRACRVLQGCMPVASASGCQIYGPSGGPSVSGAGVQPGERGGVLHAVVPHGSYLTTLRRARLSPARRAQVYNRENWTESYVQWSPHGSYLTTLHRQGVAVWGTSQFTRLHRFAHSMVRPPGPYTLKP